MMRIRKEAGGINPVLLVVLAILVVGGIVFLVMSTRSGGQAPGNNNAATDSLNAQIKSLQSQLAAADSQIKSLQDRLSQGGSSEISLQGQLFSANTKIASMTQEISALRDQITALNNTIISLESKTVTMPGLQAQINSLTEQLAGANKQIVLLESKKDLTKYSTELNAFKISQAAGALAPIHSLRAQFAGYLEISGTSSNDSTYFVIKDSFTGYPYSLYMHMFGTGNTLIIPVLPGGITIFLGNLSPSAAVDATITIKYYY